MSCRTGKYWQVLMKPCICSSLARMKTLWLRGGLLRFLGLLALSWPLSCEGTLPCEPQTSSGRCGADFTVKWSLAAGHHSQGSAALAWSDVSPSQRFAQLILEPARNSLYMSDSRLADGMQQCSSAWAIVQDKSDQLLARDSY